MKIAFLIGEFPSLSETFVLNQLTGLIERGHKVDIYASIPKITTKIHPDVEKFNLLNHTYYYPKLPKNYLLRLLKGFKLLVFNWTKNPKALLRSLNIFKYGRRAVSLRLLYAAIPFVGKQSQYDIVQCHFGIEGFKGIELKEIDAIDGNLCTTFHGLDINGLIQKHGARVFNDLMRRGDLFLPISEDCKQQLIEKGCDENKILVHRMGIDCQKFTFTPRKLRPNDKIRLVTIARLVEKKV